MSAESVALDHYRDQQRLSNAAAEVAGEAWSQVDPDNIAGSWGQVSPEVTVAVAGAQRAAANQADGYLDKVLGEQDLSPASMGGVNPAAFAGIASDGRPLDSLIRQPAIGTLVAIGSGHGVPRSLAMGGAALDMIVRTQVADAGRGADQVALTARPSVDGYTRLLVPPSCSRCAILAGRWYRYSAGFQRHPRCFPAGVVASGPGSLAATRRWYEGELVVLATAGGKQLPLTGNHPVLTGRGWIPANLVREGDHVVSSTRPEGAAPLVVPDHHQVPALIEEVWRSFGVAGLNRMPSSAEDFHGDGQDGEVHVVYADRALAGSAVAALGEHVVQPDLARRLRFREALHLQRAAMLVNLRDATHPSGPISCCGLSLARVGGHVGGAHKASLAGAAALDARFGEPFGDYATRHAVLNGQSVLAGAGQVGRSDLGGRNVASLARWDAPGPAFSIESAEGYAARGRDLLNRLAGQVELDCVVELRRIGWSGHVYSLTSAEGWHSANGLIVSNCDCRHIPANEDVAGDLTTSPRVYFDSLTQAEQDRIFTRAGAQAARDGADLNQVVNARRGMSTAAGPSGRRRLTRDPSGAFATRESTTRRGVALGQRRLMPEQIYEQAHSRDEAIELLRGNGYLRPAPRVAIPTQRIAPPRPRSFAERASAAAAGEDALAAARFGLDRRPRPEAFTREMARAVNRYTSAEYAAVNRFLRGQQLPYGYTADDVADLIPDLDAALDASRLDRDVLVWRGVANARQMLGDRIDGDLVGVEWREDTYLSLTASERRAAGFAGAANPVLGTAPMVMRVLAPRGVGAIEASGMQLEAELLLARGLRLRVVADHGLDAAGRRRIDVEVLDERSSPANPPVPLRSPPAARVPNEPGGQDARDPAIQAWLSGELRSEMRRQADLTPATHSRLVEVRVGGQYFHPGESAAESGAYYTRSERIIRLHPGWLDQPGALENGTRQAIDSRWTSRTGASSGLGYTLAHEYGHHVHRMLEDLDDVAALRGFAATIRDELRIQVDTERITSFDSMMELLDAAVRNSRDEVAVMVSEYGATSAFEMLAEIWQEFSTRGDLAPLWTQQIGRAMRDLAEQTAGRMA